LLKGREEIELSMERTTKIRNKIEELFISRKLAVLTTSNAGQPYTSLVAFWGTNAN